MTNEYERNEGEKQNLSMQNKFGGLRNLIRGSHEHHNLVLYRTCIWSTVRFCLDLVFGPQSGFV
jgi:hypothetical protein